MPQLPAFTKLALGKMDPKFGIEILAEAKHQVVAIKKMLTL